MYMYNLKKFGTCIELERLFLLQERQVQLPEGERSCVIHKCYPGTNHFIRIYACGDDERILDKSTQIQTQTSAAPSTPAVSLRYATLSFGLPQVRNVCILNMLYFKMLNNM